MVLLQPVPDEAALLLEGHTLVVADLHIGREAEMAQRGFVVPSQAGAMADRLLGLIGTTGAQTLVILGDLKHRVARSSGLERRDLPRFIERVSTAVKDFHIIKGNHDAGLEYHLPSKVKLHPSGGFVLGEVGLAHGHTWPPSEVMASRVLVMGHNHPMVAFVDRLGTRTVQRCWVRLSFTAPHEGRYPVLPREAVIMPAFNEFSGGTTFNEGRTRLLGPLLNSNLLDIHGAGIYLLNGTFLGKLRDLTLTSPPVRRKRRS